MSTSITVNLPDRVLERAERWAQRMGQPVDEVIAQVLEATLSPLGPETETVRPINEWTDEEVVAAADLQMNEAEDRQLSELLYRQQAALLTPTERGELSALMLVYQEGLLRKARGLHEAVRRGLRPPVQS